ncbi:MAG: hypothetical protein AB7M05_16005 [Alphaproteobacteria bacterium]
MRSGHPEVLFARSEASEWQVLTPSTGLLDISNSKTSGLQEAINYAAQHNLALRVVGGTSDNPPNIAQNMIQCSATLLIPPLANAFWKFEGVVIDIRPGSTGDGIRFDSVIHSRIVFDCSIHYHGNEAAMHVAPHNNYPRGEQPAFTGAEIRVARLRVRRGENPAGIKLSGTVSIARNRFDVIEIEGDILDGFPVMSRGIHVAGNHPSNWFTVQALLAPGICGIEVEGAMANRFEAHIEPCGASARGVRTSGGHGHYVLDIAEGAAPYGVGIELTESAADNSFIVQRNRGLMPLVDNAPQGRNRFL